MKAVNADDAISRQEAILQIQKYGVGCFDAEEFSPEQCERFVISKLNALPSVAPKEKIEWIPLKWENDSKMVCDFPYELDGSWVFVTNGKLISVERIKKDAYDHFFPNGRWFELPDVIAWAPLLEPYKPESEE